METSWAVVTPSTPLPSIVHRLFLPVHVKISRHLDILQNYASPPNTSKASKPMPRSSPHNISQGGQPFITVQCMLVIKLPASVQAEIVPKTPMPAIRGCACCLSVCIYHVGFLRIHVSCIYGDNKEIKKKRDATNEAQSRGSWTSICPSDKANEKKKCFANVHHGSLGCQS